MMVFSVCAIGISAILLLIGVIKVGLKKWLMAIATLLLFSGITIGIQSKVDISEVAFFLATVGIIVSLTLSEIVEFKSENRKDLFKLMSILICSTVIFTVFVQTNQSL